MCGHRFVGASFQTNRPALGMTADQEVEGVDRLGIGFGNAFNLTLGIWIISV
jgi:hypothetical protein